ncbi:shikimate dehydrogenase [Pseudomonas sp. UMAB-40]|uniref:shikimate dehydrogenase n=1 Tax=Pseudomonas sp. UMAB-40 TaxID=1365407 RepID=UPI001C5764FF|nr:shikimate dehydrogenase [Pseudomonas sp. UMAB-40]
MDRYVVIGNPIGHSKSPLLHIVFAQQTAQHMEYGALLSPLDDFAGCAARFFQGGLGANVTVPFKEEAYQLVSKLTDRALRAGAVNTISKLADGSLLGDNTDGAGLLRDLRHAGVSIEGKRILLLGAGGAARGSLEPLLAEHPAAVVIGNRTIEKAEALAMQFADLGPVTASRFESLHEPFDLIINATSASLNGTMPPIKECLIAPGRTVCYDMMYGKDATVFCRWAIENHAALQMDGLGMLVEQAAEAFYLWRGVRPQTAPVQEQIRRKMYADSKQA